MATTASDLFVERLIDWGVDTVFGLPGDGINGFMEALRKRHDRMKYVHVRHEEVGAMAAVGYARLTGKLGVCFATSGPGAIHLANGLLDARMEGVPLLAVTGMTYHDLIGTHYLQDYDTDYLYSNLAAYNQRIMSPEHITNVLDLACRTALSNRVPVHIAFPIDYQSADAEDLMRYKRNVPGHTTTAYAPPVRTPAESELRAAADLLRGKTKPAILAGQGARGARAELERLAETLGAPIAKASLGKDCVPDDSPYVTGGIGDKPDSQLESPHLVDGHQLRGARGALERAARELLRDVRPGRHPRRPRPVEESQLRRSHDAPGHIRGNGLVGVLISARTHDLAGTEELRRDTVIPMRAA